MRRVVIGKRNRVLATGDTRFVSGSELIANFAEYQQDFESAQAIVWAWYALDDSGRPDISATLRGTETILAKLHSFSMPRIFLSTDAVFSGQEGAYGEDDTPDPQTAYARVKHSQESLMSGFTRLRFTTFGPSFSVSRPLLLEMVSGGTLTVGRPHQYFSPISTPTLNNAIETILASGAEPQLYHLTSEPISKSACCIRLSKAIGVPPPKLDTIDETALNLSLTSRTHNYSLSDEITLAVGAWRSQRANR
ncbi:MAG: sugar nucleotide-binding protein [Porphyrobacter sp.]|nr:sugar nucleotide-binding protein [Porphyrobacter sp.]